MILGDNGGQAGLAHIVADLVRVGRAVGIQLALVNIVGIHFVTILGNDSRVGQPHKSGASNNDFHSVSLVIAAVGQAVPGSVL
jgi:hypothetical protein